jgi:hypothetical protein
VPTSRATEPWGAIETNHGAYGPDTPDWEPAPTHSATISDEPGPCNCVNEKFGNKLDQNGAGNIAYNPISANSNTVTSLALAAAGFGSFQPPYWSPGWGNFLP